MNKGEKFFHKFLVKTERKNRERRKVISAVSIRCRVTQNLKIKDTLILRDLIFQFMTTDSKGSYTPQS